MTIRTFRPPKPVRVPEAPQLAEHIRIINENFAKFAKDLQDAVDAGRLIGTGGITLAMLAADAKTLVGDVTGTIDANTVVKLRNKTLAAPAAGDDGKAICYSHPSAFVYTDKLTDVLTTRGDIVYRGATAETRLGVGSVNQVLKSDGTDPGWSSLSALIDAAFGSAQGDILFRGAAAWQALAPGTSGWFLKSQGAGADLVWAASTGSGVTSPLTTKGDVWIFSTTDDRLGIGTDGYVLTADSAQAKGLKWAAPAAGTNALLDGSAHTDTLAGSVARGDIIYGNSTPKWARLAKGAFETILMPDGSDVAWRHGSTRYYPTRGLMLYNSQNAANAVNESGCLKTGAATNGTRADAADTVRFSSKWTSATTPAGSAGGIGLVSGTWAQPRHYLSIRFDFKLVTVTGGCLWAGLTSTNLGNADPATAHLAAFRYLDGTDTNFMACLKDGTTLNPQSTGVLKDANWHDAVIETPDGGTTWNFYLDGVLVNSLSTNAPGTTTGLGFQVQVVLISTGTGNEIRNSYVRYATGPHLFS